MPDGVAARRGVAEAEAAGVGEERGVERLRHRLRDLEAEDAREVEHQLAGRAGGGVGDDDRARRLVGGNVVVDDELGDGERPHGVAQPAQAAHVADVEHDQHVNVAERGGPARARVRHVVGEQEAEHVGPGRRVHDARLDAHLREQAGERGLGAAAVPVGVHVRGERDAEPRPQVRGELADRRLALRADRQEVGERWCDWRHACALRELGDG
jgi:hypothetical protein